MRQPGRTDLEQKASFATEGVQRYDESSANGGRIKNLKNEENRRFSTLFPLDLHKKHYRDTALNNASVVFYSVMPKYESPLLSTESYIAHRTEYGRHYENKQNHEAK